MLGIDSAVQIMFDTSVFSDFKANLKKYSENDLKKIFREKIKQNHPDRAVLLGRDLSELEHDFKKVNEAYHVVVDYYNKFIRNPIPSIKVNNFKPCENKYKYKYKPKKESPIRPNDFMYEYDIPQRALRFSEYLFYTKNISWSQLIGSLVYQNMNRPKIGEIAISFDYIDNAQTCFIIKNMLHKEKFGEAAVRLGYIDAYKLFVLLGTQKKYGAPIGKFFVDKKLFSTNQINKFLEENKAWNMRFN